MTEEKTKNKPIHQLSAPCAGSVIRVSIWRHQKKPEDRPRYAVSMSRSHPDKTGKKWTADGFFRRDELLVLARLVESSHAWVISNETSKEAANG